MRVYEIAKEVGIPNKELLAKIRSLGLEVNNHMSSLDADAVARIKKSLERERTGAASPTETQKLSTTGAVIRRRSTVAEGGPPPPAPVSSPAISPPPVVRRRAVEPGPAAAPAHVERAPERVERHERPVAAERHERPVAAEPPAHAEPVERVHAPAPEPAHDAGDASDDGWDDDAGREAAHDAGHGGNHGSQAATATDHVERDDHHERPAAPAPEPVAEPRAAEPVERQATSAATAAPSPQVTEVAPTPAPTAAPTSAASVAPVASDGKPRSRVFVAGPVMPRAGSPTREPERPAQAAAPAPAPVTPPLPQGPRPSVIVRPRDTNPPPAQPTGPVTVQEVADTARSRFEAELERARARSAEREAQRPAVEPPPPPVVVEAPVRDPGRPAVGTVIKLPTRIQITERAPIGGRRPTAGPAPGGGPGAVRGRFAEQQAKGGPKTSRNTFGTKKLPMTKGKGKSTQLTVPAEHKRVIRMEETIAISDLARSMGVKATDVLKKLWGMGLTGVTINAAIGFDDAQILASDFGYEVQNVAFKEQDAFAEAPDDEATLKPRAPVVTIMGHVDHGKTSLLDRIRKSRVAAGEAGGITQHIAAYKVAAGANHGEIVFLDTPGHEAFTEMRARGAEATDIVVLVVAANDGVMPQTLEALSHAKDAKVPIIVAVNKVDLPDAQPDRIRQQLADQGLIPEEWGGETQYVNVSALKGENIDKLLETIALVAELADFKANPDKPAQGVVIEARLDRSRGPMATVLIQEGTLKVGEILVAGRAYGKVRAMLNHLGQTVKEAGPSTPIEILGLDGVPEAGDQVNVAEDDKTAKQVVDHRQQAWRRRELGKEVKVSFENLMERINVGDTKDLKIVLKADVQGSAEALKAALVKLATDKVKVTVVSAGVGGITEGDVNLAKAGGAIVIGFHVRPAGKSAKLAEQEGVQIRLYDIIYDALDEVKLAMAGLLAPIKREHPMGKLEVRNTFTVPKVGTVAGCMVTDGKITRKALLRLVRDSVQIYEGRVSSLRRFKDDASEVQLGYECGVMIAGYNDIKVGDVIETYEVIEEAATL